MKKVVFLTLLMSLVFLSEVLAHCEIPCGIYTDRLRSNLIAEHATTIRKSMTQINELSKKPEKNSNQLIRWVNNKEQHAEEIQHIVYQYFMTQRIKPADIENMPAYKKYTTELTLLHQMLRAAMKTKQTTDVANVDRLEQLLEAFNASYFVQDEGPFVEKHKHK